jgi:hypothetical protein
LHATKQTAADALNDEKIISQLHITELITNARPRAGRFVLDVRQTARLIRSHTIETAKNVVQIKNRQGKDFTWHVLHW